MDSHVPPLLEINSCVQREKVRGIDENGLCLIQPSVINLKSPIQPRVGPVNLVELQSFITHR